MSTPKLLKNVLRNYLLLASPEEVKYRFFILAISNVGGGMFLQAVENNFKKQADINYLVVCTKVLLTYWILYDNRSRKPTLTG